MENRKHNQDIIDVEVLKTNDSSAIVEIYNNIKKLISFIDINFSKKVAKAELRDEELTLDIYGGLDDMQVEKIMDYFNWVSGLYFTSDTQVILLTDF